MDKVDDDPKWLDNMFASRPAVVTRLEAVEGVYCVQGLKDFKQVSNPNTRIDAPIDGAVYVIKDGYLPTKDNNNSQEQFVEIGYSIILAKYDPDTDDAEEELELLITAIARTMQGFEPIDNHGDDLSLTPFTQRTPLPITHDDGFAFYPLRFVTEVAIIQN